MDREEYTKLVYRNLKGDLSPTEFALLNKETASDPTKATLRLEIEDVWDATGTEEVVVSPASTKALANKIKHSTKHSTKKSNLSSPSSPSAKIYTLRKVITSIAAIVLLCLGAIYIMRDQVQTYDQPGSYTLADNSTVSIREGSSLTVEKFSDETREVSMVGEVYFEIAKDKNRPFIVTADLVEIAVLGTQFLVKESADEAYIHLIEGRIRTRDLRTDKRLVMTSGMMARHTASGDIERSTKFTNLSAWKTGVLQYEDAPLSDVLSELSTIYGADITLTDPSMRDCTISGIFHSKSIEDVLGRVSKYFKMDLRQSANKWTLSNGSCD